MKPFLLSVSFMFFSFILLSQSLYKIDNTEKVLQSNLIVEGEVVEQFSFWNSAHTMIFTANKIKVYKIFKGGETSPDFIEILTQGGTVGNTNINASDLLELNKSDVGVFFCFPNTFNLSSPQTGRLLYDVYASSQGYFKYHVEGNTAADPFTKYSSITGEVYPLLVNLVGHPYVVKDNSFQVETKIQLRTSAVINSLSPLTVHAGATSDPAKNVLTISGTGFGAASGSAAVKFTDANAAGGYFTVAYTAEDILSWSDTQIKLRVPTRAGTGIVIVRDAAGSETTSFDILNVFYSILSATSSSITRQSNLMNANGSGGYNMFYSSNMTPEATVTFSRALKTWKEISGLNVVDAGTTGTASATGDGNCVVFLDNAANGAPLSAGVLAVCYSFTSVCSPASSTAFRKTEFDIAIRSSYSSGTTSFSYGPCAPASNIIDLETVIFHELGHALNLGHIIDGNEGSGSTANPAKLMNATVSNGVRRISPDVSAYEGSIYACATNGSINFGSCDARTGHVQLPTNVDTKDECPLVFPTVSTSPGTQISFDLQHATSNKNTDPGYTGVTCPPASTAITNNLYYVLRTLYAAPLTISVSDYTNAAPEAASCSPAATSRLTLYQVNSCPTGQNYPAAVACREFSGNGQLVNITGLAANTNYLLYVDGKSNAKATFKLTFDGGALPIKIEKFAGEIKGAMNVLNWMIGSYSDLTKLSLERSADGNDFKSISNYTGSLDLNRAYVYNDNNSFAGSNYYRLAVYNKDGSVQYSNIVLLKRNDKIKLSLYPNPVEEKINVSISSTEAVGKTELKILNEIGQLIMMKTIIVGTGTTNVEFNATGLSAGIYRLVVTDKKGNVISSRSIQKQ